MIVGSLSKFLDFGDKIVSWVLMGTICFPFTNLVFPTPHEKQDAQITHTFFQIYDCALTSLIGGEKPNPYS